MFHPSLSGSRYAVAAAALIACLPARSRADFREWSGMAEVRVNTAADGAGIRGDVHGFPLLVRLDRSNFDFTAAMGKGQDIRFSKAGSGSPLPHQIDRWDSAAGRAEIWVRLDTVRGDSRSQEFRMHWGRPGSPDASDGAAVFDTASGFLAVWHLGGSGPRANSVAGGNPAEPRFYDGDETKPGIIGLADSLDGAPEGDHLDLGDGYADFASGFTFSVWANAADPLRYAKLLDLGNGPAKDNITLFRVEATRDLAFSAWADTTAGPRVVAPGMADTRAWRHFCVTVSGRVASLYRDGERVRTDTLPFPLPGVRRTSNFIGESNWASNESFRGTVDEPVLARTARGPDWIRLAFATQRPDQAVVEVRNAPSCRAAFAAPADTAVPEGSVLLLAGTADCASDYRWSLEGGPGPRIPDPRVETLQVQLPRVRGDLTLVYRFAGTFAEGERTSTVRVTVKETLPDPEFRLPDTLLWSGKDTLFLAPALTNLAALRASGDTALTFAWSLAGVEVDTLRSADRLSILNPRESGGLRVALCVANRGIPACDTAAIAILPSLTARNPGRGPRLSTAEPERARRMAGRDAAGRILPRDRAGRISFPDR